eukprot:s987_g5.t1
MQIPPHFAPPDPASTAASACGSSSSASSAWSLGFCTTRSAREGMEYSMLAKRTTYAFTSCANFPLERHAVCTNFFTGSANSSKKLKSLTCVSSVAALHLLMELRATAASADTAA